MNRGVVAVAPPDKVTVIVSVPSAKPVVATFPRLTVAVLAVSVRETGTVG